MPDSSLAKVYIPAYTGNYTANRTAQKINKIPSKITEICVHHCAGNISVQTLGGLWQKVGRKGSSHYGVNGTSVGQYVLEKDVAWTNSNWAANCRSVTIEVANSGGAPDWKVSDASLDTLAKLVADIAYRNNLGTLVLGKNVTYHSMYTATVCPGPYLFARLPGVVEKANAINAAKAAASTPAAGPNLSAEAAKEALNVAATVTVGPMSSGDFSTITSLANGLSLPFTSTTNTVTVGPMSKGDQTSFITRAKELKLPYKVQAYTPDKYSVLAEGFTSKADADAFAAEAAKKGYTTTVKKM